MAAPLGLAFVAPSLALATDGLNLPTDFAGQLVAQQTIGTGFGDDTDPSQTMGNGSELNALFVDPRVGGDGRFRFGITGNLEDSSGIDSNGIVVYLDTRPGGENTLDANGGFSGFGDRYIPGSEGTRFDEGFFPDYGIIVNSGFGSGEYFVDVVDLNANTSSFRGEGAFGTGNGSLFGGSNPTGWQIAFDNGNTAGVGFSPAGAPDPNALTATSGLEFDLFAPDIGLAPGWTLGVQVVLTGGNNPSFFSNQSLPAFPDFTPNPEEAPIDFRAFEGVQYAQVSIVPAPSSVALMMMTAPAMVRRRRGGWPVPACLCAERQSR
jgi:hypothetical protein